METSFKNRTKRRTAMATRKSPSGLDTQLQDLHTKLDSARGEIAKRIFGQEAVIDQTLITLLAGGHTLLVGVPGLAKTLLVSTLGEVMGLSSRRIQCTPDLMPSDILGTEVLEEDDGGRKSFRFIEGPVFSQLLMADEINRASPRTQSALLQAMQERTVSVAGHTHLLPKPFHVLATQNPLEHEGTYPLPEAQLDRFMMEITVGYPEEHDEKAMIIATTSGKKTAVNAVFDGDALMAAQELLTQIPVGEKVVEGIVTLVRHARPETSPDKKVAESLAWGPGPRAGQTLLACARVSAALDGRPTPSLDDVAALAPAVLRHRMQPTFTARAEGVTVEDIIRHLVAKL
ncbi:MAG: AAA domain-containing protein [Proteobacteria bacterium]|nr:AAA domain-containing protein [Pseudomonadota bacterium]